MTMDWRPCVQHLISDCTQASHAVITLPVSVRLCNRSPLFWFKDELVPVLERFGELYELRLMMDFNGANRGYCFATYTTRVDAKRAARELNDLEIRNRRFIGACLSVDNCRLFVGGIPRNKQRQVRFWKMTFTYFAIMKITLQHRIS